MSYQLRNTDGSLGPWMPGKCVCVARNYARHAAELDNAVPAEPAFFIKPASALCDFAGPLDPPRDQGVVHHELELALLIGRRVARAADADLQAVAGQLLAIDLTLRDLQNRLKSAGLPWAASKAFAGACPVTPLLPADAVPDPDRASLEFRVNGELRQAGDTADMVFDCRRLLAEAAARFVLEPGDLLLTGTPAGVGPLEPGDRYQARINDRFAFEGRMA